jgi:cytochrome oxidase Cu insertion factor (SCO1/SenC/PrrC family)
MRQRMDRPFKLDRQRRRAGVERSAAFLAAALVTTFLTAACSTKGTPTRPREIPVVGVGQTAPAFSLPSAQGGTMSLSKFQGKPVLLYFSMGPG